jgi:hypothetical protein
MEPSTATQPKHFVGLPLSVISQVDIGRILREIESINNAIEQQQLRAPQAAVQLPKPSILLDQTIELNKINMANPQDRKNLVEFLQIVKLQAPLLHISFSADPSTHFVEDLTFWLRKEIHPLVLLTIGLQPNLGAGCVVRTTNRYFDLSLRQHFFKSRDLLMQKLREAQADGKR